MTNRLARFAGMALVGFLSITDASVAQEAKPDIVPVSGITLSNVLARHRAAVGYETDPSAYVSERWRVRDGLVDGTLTIVRQGENLRADSVEGPLHRAYGVRKGRYWAQNESGYTLLQTGIHEADISDATPTVSDVLLGQNVGTNAYVVQLTRDGRKSLFYYDRTTYLLTRLVEDRDDRFATTTYDDFAAINGAIVAKHLHTSDGQAFNDYERWLDGSSLSATEPAPGTAIPATRAPLHVPGGRVRLPAKIVGDRIIVTTQIGKRPVNFQLDTGASVILLDDGVAGALGLAKYGKSTQTVAGAFTLQHAFLPTISIGSLILNQLYVSTGPADFTADVDMPVAGLHGADFISSCVFALDYQAGTVDAIESIGFEPPSGAVAFDARLDDGVPTISAHIGAVASKKFILDTGADSSMLFSGFVAAHPVESTDQGLGTAQTAAFPFISRITGVGGKVRVRPVQVNAFGLGSIEFSKWLFLAVGPGYRAFEGQDYDGLIGQDVLRFFTVYLDYPHGKVYFVPNARYRDRFG